MEFLKNSHTDFSGRTISHSHKKHIVSSGPIQNTISIQKEVGQNLISLVAKDGDHFRVSIHRLCVSFLQKLIIIVHVYARWGREHRTRVRGQLYEAGFGGLVLF